MQKTCTTSQSLLKRAKRGFTLVELLVVTGITGLLLLTVSTMFMTVLVGRTQSGLRDQVHTEGNEIMGRIEFIVRNSVEVRDCETAGQPPVFVTISSDEVVFGQNAGKLQMITNGTTPENLNSDSVNVDQPSGFTIDCKQTPGTNKKYVELTLVLKHAETSDATITETFESIVQLRNS